MANLIYRIQEFDTLPSTNEEAKRLAEAGAPEGTVIRADEQTAGRGRRGREWVSERGNFFASILLRPEVPMAQVATLPFAGAVAVGDTLAPKLRGDVTVEYKWPNDVLINGRKVAGILSESGGSPRGFWAVLGIGINLVSYPDETLYPATALKEAGVEEAPDVMLDRFLKIFDPLYASWRAHGFAPIRRAWLRRAKGLGERLEVRIDGRTIEGRFEDIEEDGTLRLTLADGGSETVTAGDVFFD